MKPWLLIIVLLLFNNAASQLEQREYQLNEKTIQYYAKKIRWELNRNVWLRRLTYTGIVSTIGYFMYAWYKHHTVVISPPHRVVSMPPLSSDQLDILLSSAYQHLQQERAEQDAYTSIVGWFKMNINASVQQVGAVFIVELLKGTFKPVNDIFVLVDSLLDRLFVTIFHSGNIAWFVQHRTRMNDLWRELEKHAHGFDEIVITDMYRSNITQSFHYQSLLATWTIALRHVTQIVAFMYVKTEWRMRESVIIGEQMRIFTTHIIEIMNTCWLDLEKALATKEAVVPIINRTHLAYDKVLEGFALFEKVKDH